MAGKIDARLAELGIELSAGTAPVANYVPYVVTGNLVFISGQASVSGDGKITGKVGADLSVEDGQAAARLCARNLLSHLKAACGGDLDRVVRCVKLGGFVNSPAEFGDHPNVINGASDLMVEVFGDAGRHARFAVGAPALPFDFAVEVDAVFEIA
jgi:enamine deaminase RidA (YjgF/YER057c/UK114 family)